MAIALLAPFPSPPLALLHMSPPRLPGPARRSRRMRPYLHLGFSVHEAASAQIERQADECSDAYFQLERIESCPELGSVEVLSSSTSRWSVRPALPPALTRVAPAMRYTVPAILEPLVLSRPGLSFNRAARAGARTGRPTMLATDRRRSVREALLTEPTRPEPSLAPASPPELLPGLPRTDYAAEATAQIEIGCDVGRALAAYADLERFPEYAPLLQSVRIVGEGRSAWALQVPRLVASVARAIGMGSLVRWEAAYAVEASPPRLTWQSVTGFRNAGEARFEPLGAGRCRVTVRMTYSVPLTLRPLEGSAVVTRLISSTMRGAMERFKADLEEEEGEGSSEARPST